MSDKPIKAKPALFCFFYEDIKIIAKEYGYNLVLHGSMNRDLDLIAIPWVDEPKDEFEMIKAFERHFFGRDSDYKEHYLHSVLPGGRNSYVINLNRGGKWNEYHDPEYYIDISVTPLLPKQTL